MAHLRGAFVAGFLPIAIQRITELISAVGLNHTLPVNIRLVDVGRVAVALRRGGLAVHVRIIRQLASSSLSV
jgi:hypothetical protein